MLQSLRPLLTKILNPLARNLNINPNIVTVISPFVALLAAYGFANKMLILGMCRNPGFRIFGRCRWCRCKIPEGHQNSVHFLTPQWTDLQMQ